MRFYHVQPEQHYFCGIDLHTKALYLCVLDQAGQKPSPPIARGSSWPRSASSVGIG